MMDAFPDADASAWEDWQKEYRFGACYIFPPPGVIEPVDALRRRYDPRSASYCQAHVSLSEPLSGPLTSQQLTELRAASCASIEYAIPNHSFYFERDLVLPLGVAR